MLVADFAILVAVAIVETGLAHAALYCARKEGASSLGTKWQPSARTSPGQPPLGGDWRFQQIQFSNSCPAQTRLRDLAA
jgi:hypothetical protein